MPLWVDIAIPLFISIFLIVLGRFVGKSIERRHYRSISAREAQFREQPALTTKDSDPLGGVVSAQLAMGSVVVSVDHFKRFLSGFRMIFGGEVRSYSSLIDRARREAVLRMKESEPDADIYVNTRLETSTITSTSSNEGIGTIEVLAYATAVKLGEPRLASLR